MLQILQAPETRIRNSNATIPVPGGTGRLQLTSALPPHAISSDERDEYGTGSSSPTGLLPIAYVVEEGVVFLLTVAYVQSVRYLLPVRDTWHIHGTPYLSYGGQRLASHHQARCTGRTSRRLPD
jgi:hypothetical protein